MRRWRNPKLPKLAKEPKAHPFKKALTGQLGKLYSGTLGKIAPNNKIHEVARAFLPDVAQKILGNAPPKIGKPAKEDEEEPAETKRGKGGVKIPSMQSLQSSAKSLEKLTEGSKTLSKAGGAAGEAGEAAGLAEAGAGAAGAGEAAEGLAGLAALGGPVGITIAAIVALGAAVVTATVFIVGLPDKIRDFTDGLLDANRKFAAVSGSMAVVMAQLDMAKLQHDQRMGEALAPSAAALAESSTRLNNAMESQDKFWANLKNLGGTALNNAGASLAKTLEPIFNTLNQILEALLPPDTNNDQPWFINFVNETAGRATPKLKVDRPENPYDKPLAPVRDFIRDPAGTLKKRLNPFAGIASLFG